MSTQCTIKRNTNGQVTNVLQVNGKESKLFKTIAKHPLIKDTEQAVKVMYNTYSKVLYNEAQEIQDLEDASEVTNIIDENIVSFTHRINNSVITNSYKEALLNVEEGDVIELGFSGIEGFNPIITVRKNTDKATEDGYVNNMIESGYLSEERAQVGIEYRFKAAGATEIGQLLNAELVQADAKAHLGGEGVIRDGNTFKLTKTNDKTRVISKTGEVLIISIKELDAMPYEELKQKYDNAQDIVVAREWSKLKPAYSSTTPTVTEDSFIRSSEEIELSLLNFLSKLGVKTMSIAEYVKKHKIRHGVNPSAKALADIANEVIAYTKGDIVELAEETAHFINEALPQAKVENVLRNIHKTEEWAEFSQMYYDAYSKEYSGAELGAVVRREVLGKIVAKTILNQQTASKQMVEGKPELQQNIFQTVWKAVSDFFKALSTKFKAAYILELNNYLKEVEALMSSNDITSEVNLDNFKYNKFRFYHLYDSQDTVTQIRKRAGVLAFQLQDTEKVLIRAGVGSRATSNQLGKVQKDLERTLEEQSIAAIIQTVNSSIKYVEAAIKEAKSKNQAYFLTGEENIAFQSIKGYAGKAVGEIKVLLKELKIKEKTNAWDALIKEAEVTSGKIEDLKANAELIDSNNVERLVEHVLEKYNLPATEKANVAKWVKKAESDTNYFHATFGQLVHAKDGLLNLQSYLLKDMANYQQVKYFASIKKFQDTLSKLGVPESEISKFVDGSYILSEWNFNDFERDTNANYLTSYMQVVRDTIPLLEAEITVISAINSPTLEELEQLKEIKAKLVTFKEYTNKTPEELEKLRLTKNLEALSTEQEADRKAIARPLDLPNLERTMKASYYEAYEEKLKVANVSKATKGEIANHLSSLSYFRKKATKKINGVSVTNFQSLSEADKIRLSEVYKRRKYVKSYINDLGKLKPGLRYIMENNVIKVDEFGAPLVEIGNPLAVTDETQIAIDLHKLDEGFEVTERTELAHKFYTTLTKIDKEEGREAALEFIRLNAYTSLQQDFWANLTPGKNIVAKLKEEKNITADNKITVNDLIYDITTASFELKAILKLYNAKGNPSEIEVEYMTPGAKDRVRVLQNEIRNKLAQANKYLTEPEVSEEETEGGLKGVSEVNKAYKDQLTDLRLIEDVNDTPEEALSKALQELHYAKDHMIEFNASSLEGARIDMDNFRDGSRASIPVSVERAMDALGFNDTDMQEAGNYAEVVRYMTRSRLLPYYKRFTSEEYSIFEEGLQTTDNLSEYLLKDPRVKKAFVEITPSYNYFDNDTAKDKNPEYVENFRGGYLQPNKAKYKSAKFEELFGVITEGPMGVKTPSKNEKLYRAYEAVLEFNAEALEAMNVGEEHNQYLLPQTRRNTIERVAKFLKGNLIQNSKNFSKDILTYTEDELIQGEKMYGTDVKIIPKMYINRLENPEDVSTELFYSLALRSKEAFSREAKVKYFGDLMSIHDKILTRDMNGKNPSASNTYRMAVSAIDNSLFGVKETVTYPVNTPFGTVDLTKLARTLLGFVKFRNLGLNIIIPLTSWLTGEATRRMEMFVGELIDTRSQNLGAREYRKLAVDSMTEIGKINTKAKINVLGQYLKAFDINASFESSNYGWLARMLPRSAMVLHSAMNFPIYGKNMLGILHDFRIVDGKLTNKNEYLQDKKAQGIDNKIIESDWTKLEDEAFYKYFIFENNSVRIDKDALGKILTKEGILLTEEELETEVGGMFSRVQKYIQHVNSLVDGQIPEEDRVLAQRHYLLSYFMTHRGWLSIAVSRRFKNRHFNMETGLIEEGSYRSMWNFAGGIIKEWKDGNFINVVEAYKKAWDAGGEVQRRNMRRIMIEAASLSTLMVLSLALRYAAEDDDNEDIFALQMSNYLMFRTINELSSVQLNIVSNFAEAVEAPFVGWQTMKTLVDIGELTSTEEVSSGVYKGFTDRERYLIKLVPGAKQTFDLTDMNRTYETYKFYNKRNFSVTPAAMLWNRTIDAPDKE